MTQETIKRFLAVKSPEELLSLAKEHNINLTPERAAKHFTTLNARNGAIADDELDNVAGGDSCSAVPQNGSCDFFLARDELTNYTKRCGDCKHYGFGFCTL